MVTNATTTDPATTADAKRIESPLSDPDDYPEPMADPHDGLDCESCQ